MCKICYNCLLDNSKSDDPTEAELEWTSLKLNNINVVQCICGTSSAYCSELTNIYNNRKIILGNICISTYDNPFFKNNKQVIEDGQYYNCDICIKQIKHCSIIEHNKSIKHLNNIADIEFNKEMELYKIKLDEVRERNRLLLEKKDLKLKLKQDALDIKIKIEHDLHQQFIELNFNKCVKCDEFKIKKHYKSTICNDCYKNYYEKSKLCIKCNCNINLNQYNRFKKCYNCVTNK